MLNLRCDIKLINIYTERDTYNKARMYVFNRDQTLQKHTNISFEYKAREGYYNVVMLKKKKIINLGKHTSPHELYIYKDREIHSKAWLFNVYTVKEKTLRKHNPKSGVNTKGEITKKPTFLNWDNRSRNGNTHTSPSEVKIVPEPLIALDIWRELTHTRTPRLRSRRKRKSSKGDRTGRQILVSGTGAAQGTGGNEPFMTRHAHLSSIHGGESEWQPG